MGVKVRVGFRFDLGVTSDSQRGSLAPVCRAKPCGQVHRSNLYMCLLCGVHIRRSATAWNCIDIFQTVNTLIVGWHNMAPAHC